MNNTIETLKKFGLAENEAKVYIEALKKEETSPYALSQATGIPRTTVYDILTSLSLKGLVNLKQSDGISKQQTKIKAKNPSHLREILKKKKKDISLLELDILNILPQLKEDFHKNKANANFQFYPGISGAKKVYLSELALDLETLAFENLMPMDVFGRKEINADVKTQTESYLKAKIKLKELIVLDDWAKHVLSYQVGIDKNYLVAREIKYIDNPILKIKQRIVIQGHYLKISCTEEDEAWGIIIKSQSLTNTVKSIFDLLWQEAHPIDEKLVKSWGENELLKAEKSSKEN